jgi:hypothetical protein
MIIVSLMTASLPEIPALRHQSGSMNGRIMTCGGLPDFKPCGTPALPATFPAGAATGQHSPQRSHRMKVEIEYCGM